MPAQNTLRPESRNICIISGIIACFSLANIILVFNTSNGVVIPAATAPAKLPKTPLSTAVTSRLPFVLILHSFIPSHNGNCITVNGTSLITVILHPLYISLHTPPTPILLLKSTIDLNPASELGACTACARCFTTSVGTLTAHAATSPTEAATMCSTGSAHLCFSNRACRLKKVLILS